MKTYTPSQKILENYAKVLVNFALGGGKGIKKNEVVWLSCPEYAKPLYLEIYRAIIRSGGHVISNYHPDADSKYNFEKEFYINAQEHQISFFPAKYMKGIVDEMDHMIAILCETDKKALQGIDPIKIMKRSHSRKPYMDWRDEKEHAGKFTWTLGLYGTQAMAAEAGMTEKQYWDQIIKACFLDTPNPIARWRQIYRDLDKYIQKLNRMQIDRVHIVGPDANLWIKIGDKRQWLGGSGRNIPSFEIFTSPDWRGTNGWMKFNQPLYRYGNLIEGIRLEFKDGKVTKATARKNEKMLKQMIATENADKLGEFSMTDGRFSHITKFMAETLYDENVGGPEGNTHVALGKAYADTFSGNVAKLNKKDQATLGFNDSSVHTDVVSTAPRTITAYFKKAEPKLIYKNGQYQF
jgi:aminopeptidase